MNDFLDNISILWATMTDEQKKVFTEVIAGMEE